MSALFSNGEMVGGSVENTDFTSSDVADGQATSWTTVTPIVDDEPNVSLFTKLSQIAKNVRYLYKKLTAVNDSQKFSAWTLLNSGTGSGSEISGTITNYAQYDEFMVILRNPSFVVAQYVFDKNYVNSTRHFVGTYYYPAVPSSSIFITLSIHNSAYKYGDGGGEVNKGAFEIYGRKYA